MPVFAGNATSGQVAGLAAQLLAAHRKALADIADFYAWLSAQSDGDLETGMGFAAGDVTLLRSAMADANEETVLHNGGGLGTYTLPYNFGASQRLVIGPRFPVG